MSSNPSPGFVRNPQKVMAIEPYKGTVAVSAGGIEFARTNRAKMLTEPPYAGALYIPFDDIDFEKLSKTAHSSHCPYKGDASYWSVVPAGEAGTNAMWAYETPFDEASAIAKHGAFYPDRVKIEAVAG